MKPGARWIAFDAYFYGSPFAVRLRQQFGLVGPAVFVAFLCACKRSRTPGEISFMSDAEAVNILGIEGSRLVDDEGKEWTLDDFWTFCGRMKNVARTRRGRLQNVRATHWERWQEDAVRGIEREKKRRQRGKNEGDIDGTERGTASGRVPENVPLDRDIDRDIDISPPTPSETGDENTPPPPDQNRGDRSITQTNTPTPPSDPVVDWIRKCVPGTGHAAAAKAVAHLRRIGVGDDVIEEAAGYAAEHDGKSAIYVEQIAIDWMTQRDPKWAPPIDTTDPRRVGDILKEIRR